MNILNQLHWVPGLYPAADCFAGGVSTDIVSCRSAVGVDFLIFRGDSTGGTTTGVVTIQGCDTVVPGTATAVPFWYRTSTTPDTWSAWTHVAATGFTMTAGDNQMYECWVEAAELAELGYEYCRMGITEPVNDPVVAAVAIAVIQTRYQPVTTTVLT